VIDPSTVILAVEAASGNEWYKYADDVLCMHSFGASANANDLFSKFHFTIKGIKERVFEMLDRPYQETTINNCKI